MWRLSDDLAKEIMAKIKTPEIESLGPNMFLPKTLNSVGIIDPMVAIGTDYHYSIECPFPVIAPELPSLPANINGYFLYRREELLQLMQPWMITKALVDSSASDYTEQIDARDCAIILPNDIDKLMTPITRMSLEQFLEREPKLAYCLNLEK